MSKLMVRKMEGGSEVRGICLRDLVVVFAAVWM